MQNNDTILIFQEPNLYFFPHYKNITFKPYDISEKSLSYLLYRALSICRIPFYQHFWGQWKKHIRTARQVIIFDYGYQYGMEKYIHKINPECRVYLFMWNKIDAAHKNHTVFSDKSAIYSTDPEDCKQYHLKYQHIFYPKEYYTPYTREYQKKLFFIGHDKNRGQQIHALKKILTQSGIHCDIRVFTNRKDTSYLAEISDIVTTSKLSYEQYLQELSRCGILLDIVQKGQTALTMRVLESLFLSKKLITNNQSIRTYDFYTSDNILILPEVWDSSLVPVLQEFIEKPFVPYSETILSQYDFSHWVENF